MLLISCSKPPRTIAFVPETSGTELWESAHAIATSTARAAGYSLYWNAAAREDDVARQIAILGKQDMHSLAGVIVAPANSLAALNAVGSLQQMGKPVAVLRSALPVAPSRSIRFFINDEDASGRLIAERIKAKLGNRASIAVVGMNRTSQQKLDRLASLQRSLSATSAGLTIQAIREGRNDPAEDEEAADELLVAKAPFDAVIAMDSSSMTGILAASRVHPSKALLLIGCGQEFDLMLAVRTGEIDSILAENSNIMAQLAMDFIRDYSKGSPGPPSQRVQPVLVDKENIDMPQVQKILSSPSRYQ